jgi:hypothetical protein
MPTLADSLRQSVSRILWNGPRAVNPKLVAYTFILGAPAKAGPVYDVPQDSLYTPVDRLRLVALWRRPETPHAPEMLPLQVFHFERRRVSGEITLILDRQFDLRDASAVMPGTRRHGYYDHVAPFDPAANLDLTRAVIALVDTLDDRPPHKALPGFPDLGVRVGFDPHLSPAYPERGSAFAGLAVLGDDPEDAMVRTCESMPAVRQSGSDVVLDVWPAAMFLRDVEADWTSHPIDGSAPDLTDRDRWYELRGRVVPLAQVPAAVLLPRPAGPRLTRNPAWYALHDDLRWIMAAHRPSEFYGAFSWPTYLRDRVEESPQDRQKLEDYLRRYYEISGLQFPTRYAIEAASAPHVMLETPEPAVTVVRLPSDPCPETMTWASPGFAADLWGHSSKLFQGERTNRAGRNRRKSGRDSQPDRNSVGSTSLG